MKVLFDHPQPFVLAHGGFQTQIEQTKAALEGIGVEVEHLRWWDDSQKGDIIHYFGRPPEPYIRLAQSKNIKVVVGELLGGLGSRSFFARSFQKSVMRLAEAALPSAFTMRMAWKSFRMADACTALTPWEALLMTEMFGAPTDRVCVIPNGVEAAFLDGVAATRGPWLVCTATITERKRVVELAEAAIRAKTPLWILGKPYAENDPYAAKFLQIVRPASSIIRYEGAVNDRSKLATIYRQARGFVLLSTLESLSLSALEAAACGCPLLLSDLPWARFTFGDDAAYCPISRFPGTTARVLRRFYDAAPSLKAPARPKGWPEVGRLLKDLYGRLLRTSR